MSIVITGGGTGGHLVIAKAIKEELNKREIKPIFIGSTYGQDRDWFEDDEGWSERYFFDTTTVVNKRGFAKLKALYEISKKVIEVKKIFEKNGVNKVLSVGGYSAAPASFASILYRKKLYIHEQNAIMGKLNQILKPFATYIFENDSKYYPIREIFFDNARLRSDIKTIIFLGGSQGAKAINDFALKIVPTLKSRGIKIIHQTGKSDFKRVEKFYKDSNLDVELFAFSKELPRKVVDADFAICRAGASTLWELCASGLPALYIPYPYAAANHQYYNAKFLADKNLSLLSKESDLDMLNIEEIFDLDIKTLSKGLIKLAKKDGAKNIVDFMLK